MGNSDFLGHNLGNDCSSVLFLSQPNRTIYFVGVLFVSRPFSPLSLIFFSFSILLPVFCNVVISFL